MKLFRVLSRVLCVVISMVAITTALSVAAPAAGPLEFPEITREAKPWTWWWWLGSAVDEGNLTRSLEEFSEAGLGGVQITPIYGVKGQEHRHIDHLTSPWLDMLAHTTTEAQRLGLGVDMSTGTGWPFGGPTVTLEDADMKVTIAKADIGAVGDSLDLPEGAVLLSLMAYGADGSVTDITAGVKEGVVTGSLPAGEVTYYVVYYRFSGRKVKRAAPGGVGFTINAYSETALSKYLDLFGQAMAKLDGPPLRAHYHDSFEYLGDWTPTLWAAFEEQHGYDLRQHLPEMMGEGDVDRVARIKSDYRETLADLLLNDFVRQWTGWAHAQGAITRNQAHGSPGNLIDLYAAADTPETEIFGPSGFPIPGLRKDLSFDNEPPDLLMLKFASSAAHVSGKRRVSSETCTWLGEHFQVALAQAKPEVDQLFAAGINHVFYHGIPYSPDDAAWPGWLFYASVHFGPSNTWWEDFQFLNGYVGRCQALLQDSTPANDVLLYFPLHDIWHDAEGLRKQCTVHNIDDWLVGTPFYETAQALTERGYAFDYVSDAFLEGADVDEGSIVLGEGRYKVVVVPDTPRMHHTTLERLFKLAQNGAKVVFLGEMPEDVPGFGTQALRQQQMDALNGLWGRAAQSRTATGAVPMGEGKIYEARPLDSVLADLHVAPETLATSGLSMIRKKHEEGYLYFVSNLTATAVDAFWPLGTTAKSVVWLDPLTTKAGVAHTRGLSEGDTQVRIALKPGESCFLRTYTDREVVGEPWPYWEEAGPAVPLSGAWNVAFVKGGPVLPESYTAAALSTWTNAPDSEAKRFGGTARYELTFDAPALDATAWRLDLGTVCESARVTLNGTFIGCAWSLPYELVLDQPLKATRNVLSIEVTNLAANRIADMDRRKVEWKIFHNTNIVNIQYKPFDASEWPLMDSGLLGPVRLVPLKTTGW